MSKLKGPELITMMQGDVTAEVQLEAHKFATVHTNMLKTCRPRQCSQWLRRAQANLQVRIMEEAGPAT